MRVCVFRCFGVPPECMDMLLLVPLLSVPLVVLDPFTAGGPLRAGERSPLVVAAGEGLLSLLEAASSLLQSGVLIPLLSGLGKGCSGCFSAGGASFGGSGEACGGGDCCCSCWGRLFTGFMLSSSSKTMDEPPPGGFSTLPR